MKLLCELIGRKQSANTSPKALLREIARSKSEKLTPQHIRWLHAIILADQCERLMKTAKKS